MKNAVYICDPDVRINQQIAVGLSAELQKHDAWNIHVLPFNTPFKKLKQQIADIEPDAMALWFPSLQLVEHLEQLSIPQVVVSNRGEAKEELPIIIPDDEAIGQMAADYLLAQKFEHFALVDYARPELTGRADRFCREIERRCKTLSTYWLKDTKGYEHPFGWHPDSPKLAQWLEQLPKPCAIFVHFDQAAAHVIRTCTRYGIGVLDEVSVLGVDDDPLYCQTVMPNLASIHLPYTRMGTEAAKILLGNPAEHLMIPPTTVVERASCRPPRRGDPLVDKALEYLRTEVAKGVRVHDLQKLTGLTSHQLIYRFNIVTGRTPIEMILTQRIDTAKRLLSETTEPIAKIARQSGFNSTNQFYVTFRNATGMSPTDYRNQLAP